MTTDNEIKERRIYENLPKNLYITIMDRGKYGSVKHNWSAIMIWKKSDDKGIGSIVVQDNFFKTALKYGVQTEDGHIKKNFKILDEAIGYILKERCYQ